MKKPERIEHSDGYVAVAVSGTVMVVTTVRVVLLLSMPMAAGSGGSMASVYWDPNGSQLTLDYW